MRYLLLFLLPLSLFASKILSYNIYERTDRADVMLTFDTPFSGKISQSSSDSKIIIKLEETSIESAKLKSVASSFLRSLSITPINNEVLIVAATPSSVRLIASKTADAYGLRLRFVQKNSSKSKKSIQDSGSNPLAALPTKSDDSMTKSYYIVVIFLVIGIIILYIVKRKILMKSSATQQKGWLFKETLNSSSDSSAKKAAPSMQEVSIRFQKSIDTNNSVVMLDFGSQSYLVLMGASNILLDKFTDDKPTTEQEFENILQNRHQELEDFLRNNPMPKTKEPLQAYKERAASLAYSEEM